MGNYERKNPMHKHRWKTVAKETISTQACIYCSKIRRMGKNGYMYYISPQREVDK